jgi:hypothetical protein
MHANLKKILFLAFLLFICSWTIAQTRFSASLSPSRINKDEYVTFRLVVENASNVQQIEPPSFRDFMVISGPNEESGMNYINGVVKNFISLSYVLQPRKPGRFSFKPARALVGGKVMISNGVTLQVQDAISGKAAPNAAIVDPFAGYDPFAEGRSSAEFDDYLLRKGENIAEKVSRNMILKLHTDKTTCYVGEPIIATYKLYTRLKSESKLTKNPSFNGFSVIDLQQADVTGYGREKLNGKEYNVYTIRKAQLYPLQPGQVELESATLDNQVEFVKAERGNAANINSLFDGFNIDPDAMVVQPVSLTSKPLTITVKPLPVTGKPASFSGVVGQFSLVAELEKKSFSTDEAGALMVRIAGSGNLQLLTAPDVQWPAGIEAFEPKVTDNIVTRTVPVSGTKTFRYSFTADKPGEYTIPSLEFSYFDPATGSYKIIASGPFSFSVSKGTGSSFSNNALVDQKEPALKGEQKFSNLMLLMAGIALLAFIIILILVLRKKKQPARVYAEPAKNIDAQLETAISEAVNNKQNPLEETEACLYGEDCVEFYTLLNKELKHWLAQKFSLNEHEISSRSIVMVMDKSGIDNQTVLELQRLLQQVEWQLYTPFEAGNDRQMFYSRAQELVQMINSYTQELHHRSVNL